MKVGLMGSRQAQKRERWFCVSFTLPVLAMGVDARDFGQVMFGVHTALEATDPAQHSLGSGGLR
jgi:hypothetical protein